MMELDKEVENLAPAAIRKGCYLTMPMLDFLQKTYKFAMPDPKKKQGSGKGGALKKEDFAWAAVQFFFPQDS